MFVAAFTRVMLLDGTHRRQLIVAPIAGVRPTVIDFEPATSVC
jgi:hypothetical protein